jgi:methyl-accepting chemotaxis protein
MSWLNDLKIALKVSLIVVLMATVTVGTVIFATQRMRMAADANTDIVTRVDKSTTLAVRAARFAENYVSSAFQLAAETTDEGNARYLAQTDTSRKAYESLMATVRPRHQIRGDDEHAGRKSQSRGAAQGRMRPALRTGDQGAGEDG